MNRKNKIIRTWKGWTSLENAPIYENNALIYIDSALFAVVNTQINVYNAQIYKYVRLIDEYHYTLFSLTVLNLVKLSKL